MRALLLVLAIIAVIALGARAAWRTVRALRRVVRRPMVMAIILFAVSAVVGVGLSRASYATSAEVRVHCLPLPCAVTKAEAGSWTDYASPFAAVVEVVDVLLGASLVWMVAAWVVARRLKSLPGATVPEVHNRDAPR